MIVFIDSGVLGLLTNPNKVGKPMQCENWLYSLLAKGIYVVSSDICDYEVRRSRRGKGKGKGKGEEEEEEGEGEEESDNPKSLHPISKNDLLLEAERNPDFKQPEKIREFKRHY